MYIVCMYICFHKLYPFIYSIYSIYVYSHIVYIYIYIYSYIVYLLYIFMYMLATFLNEKYTFPKQMQLFLIRNMLPYNIEHWLEKFKGKAKFRYNFLIK